MAFVCKRSLPRLNNLVLFSIMSFQSTFGEHVKQDFNRNKTKSLFCLGFEVFFLHFNSLSCTRKQQCDNGNTS